MSRSHDQQAIALAGMFQAASLVDQIANRGMVAQNNYQASLASLFVTSPENTEAVFGGVQELPYNLSLGLKVLRDLVDKKQAVRNNSVTNYMLSMIMLEKHLSKQPQMLQQISQRLESIREQARYFNADDPQDSQFSHSNVVANIASLYQDTISRFRFRIQVTGDPRHLQNAENAAKIRALLLAGIRSAMLWRQVGGKRWHLLFFRSRLRPSLVKITH